jgi:site-specific DNA recombinase
LGAFSCRRLHPQAMKRSVKAHDQASATGAKRVAAYIRVSRSREDMLSPEIQKNQIAAYCLQRNWEVPEHGWFEDISFSGRTTVRPSFQRMIAEAKAGSWNIIVVYSLSRFGRSANDCLRLFNELEGHGVIVASVKEQLDPTPGGRLMRTVLAAMAEFESDLTAERIRDAHERLAEEGHWPGGHPPYGFRYEGKKLVADPAELPIVQFVFNSFLAGMSMEWIARDLNRRALSDPLWQPRKVGAHWAHTHVRSILQGAHYIGQRRTDTGLTGNGDFIAQLIPEEEWRAAQELLVLHQREPHSGRPSNRYAIPGRMVRCCNCGFAMTIKEGKKGYPYYRCSQRSGGVCDTDNAIPVPILEAEVERLTMQRLRTLDTVPGEPAQHPWPEAVRSLVQIHKDRDKVKHKLADLWLAMSDGKVSYEEYSLIREKLLEQIKRLDQEAETATKRIGPTRDEVRNVWQHLGEFLQHSWGRMEPLEKRAVYEVLVTNITVNAKDVSPRFQVNWRE